MSKLLTPLKTSNSTWNSQLNLKLSTLNVKLSRPIFCSCLWLEGKVEKGKLICATGALIVAIAGAGCSSARGDERAAGGGDSGSGDAVTIAGCLTAGPDGKFALTAAPDAAVSTAARAMDNERDTHSYVLSGGDNLQAHLGKRVEVTGHITGKTQEMEQESSRKTTTAPATSGGDTPAVKTTEDIDMEVRQLAVRSVREVAPTCVVNP
jgi:hypothetical protein